VIDTDGAEELVRADTAFEAMRAYLKAFWERGEIDDPIVWLLSSTEPMANGMPIDQAQWHDFLAAIDKVKKADTQ
jgi:hypothetical protein